jgi:hypothetical protein
MATNFPTSLDTFTNPNSGNTLDSPSHSIQHSDINDAVEAIEAKIGIGSSTAGSATAGYALVNTSGGTTAYSLLGVSGLSSGTAVANTVLTANGSGGAGFTTTPMGVLLVTQSFSAVSAASLPDNTFTTTYNAYRIICNFVPSIADTTISARVRAGGTDNTSSNYNIYTTSYSGSVTVSRTQTTTWLLGDFRSTENKTIEFFELFNLAQTEYTSGQALTVYGPGISTLSALGKYLGLSVTTAYDSLTIYPGSGTITGSISCYGFNK